MAQLLKTDGTFTEVAPKDNLVFTLGELYGFVGRPVDILYLPSGKRLVVNDEGKLTGLPYNAKASEIWKEEFPVEHFPVNNDQMIVGDVLIATPEELGEEE